MKKEGVEMHKLYVSVYVIESCLDTYLLALVLQEKKKVNGQLFLSL